MRKLTLGLVCTLIIGAVAAMLSGLITLVETHGNSMAPRMSTGDLILVHASNTYRVGDVVAYASPQLSQTVLHRVVSIDNGKYTLRGDHNTFDDPEQPTDAHIIGKELLHIPAGGIWLDRLTSPIALAAGVFAVLAAGGASLDRRRRRRKERTRRTPMAQHAARSRSARATLGWHPRWRTAMAAAAVLLSMGLALGVISWPRPLDSSATVTEPKARTMTFTYRADVPATPAYDEPRVTAPDPIFRRITETVDVRYEYRGEPGTVSVAAELSTPSGWRSTVPLQPPVRFQDTDHSDTIRLDLNQLERHAQEAADAIGIPAPQVDLAIVPTISTADGEIFAPELRMALTPLQLTLVGGPSSLEVVDQSTTGRSVAGPGPLQVAGYAPPVALIRDVSVALIVAAFAVMCFGVLIATRKEANEGASIKRRYAHILLPVETITSPPGRSVVDVTDFVALAKLAQRYDLMVMHSTRADVDTFIVHDDGVTYRYRAGVHTLNDDAGREPTSAPVTTRAAITTARAS